MNLLPDNMLIVKRMVHRTTLDAAGGEYIEVSAKHALMNGLAKKVIEPGRYIIAFNWRWLDGDEPNTKTFVATAVVSPLNGDMGEASTATVSPWRRLRHWWLCLVTERVKETWRAAFPW